MVPILLCQFFGPPCNLHQCSWYRAGFGTLCCENELLSVLSAVLIVIRMCSNLSSELFHGANILTASVLWRCLLADRKSIRHPARKSPALTVYKYQLYRPTWRNSREIGPLNKKQTKITAVLRQLYNFEYLMQLNLYSVKKDENNDYKAIRMRIIKIKQVGTYCPY